MYQILVAILIMAGCMGPLPSENVDYQGLLSDTIQNSYYGGQKDPAFSYFQHSSIQNFLAMWVKEETQDIENPQWDLDSFTEIKTLDHALVDIHPDTSFYSCTFTDGENRFGYVMISYDETGPSISNWGVTETTPYIFDLRANWEAIRANLQQTDIDLSTTTASRVSLMDKEKKRGDQVICFTDGKGDRYLCYLEDPSFHVTKWEAQ